MIHEKPLYDFDDLAIMPEIMSSVASRSEINPYNETGFLPLMTAPMDTVVNEKNAEIFYSNRIKVVLPRTVDAYMGYVSYNDWKWRSYSMEQFREVFIDGKPKNTNPKNKIYVLIDVAQGHMWRLYNLIKEGKEKNPNLVIMVGNIANPSTFEIYASLGVDYCRLGIGGGAACTTAANCGIFYPMASLIDACYQIKIQNNYSTQIVADGGFKKFADIIKAIGLGCNYVMIGSLFNKALESCSEKVIKNEKYNYDKLKDYFFSNRNQLEYYGIEYTEPSLEDLMKKGILYNQYRGMSTKEVQKDWNKEKLTTSEGIITYQKVEYTLASWVDNFTDYLKSAMSYTNSKTLNEFRGNVQLNVITQQAFNRFHK